MRRHLCSRLKPSSSGSLLESCQGHDHQHRDSQQNQAKGHGSLEVTLTGLKHYSRGHHPGLITVSGGNVAADHHHRSHFTYDGTEAGHDCGQKSQPKGPLRASIIYTNRPITTGGNPMPVYTRAITEERPRKRASPRTSPAGTPISKPTSTAMPEILSDSTITSMTYWLR